ncbi:hypothetical protein [Cohnella cholangitidis]|uniref:hypothetical protein n=1 Tax=Cohnella cholangitidis TaxID=2598458 RepID=UPI0015FA5B19|nr:hypothetical protein [Cohnella cholangitidis]
MAGQLNSHDQYLIEIALSRFIDDLGPDAMKNRHVEARKQEVAKVLEKVKSMEVVQV